jgi:hypothetical protein
LSSITPRDIDRILDAIRAEAQARGSKSRVGQYATGAPGTVGGAVASHGLGLVELQHAADFLALPLDVFLWETYRHFLGRNPDPAGAAHYQRQLLAGRLTRIEVLGRFALSAEARRRGVSIRGVVLPALVATFYRVPVLGPAAALVARILRLPAHWQDRSTLEAAAFATGTWMKR